MPITGTYRNCLKTVNSLITQKRIYDLQAFIKKTWGMRQLTNNQQYYLQRKFKAAFDEYVTDMMWGRILLWQIPKNIRTVAEYRHSFGYVCRFNTSTVINNLDGRRRKILRKMYVEVKRVIELNSRYPLARSFEQDCHMIIQEILDIVSQKKLAIDPAQIYNCLDRYFKLR